MPHDNENTFNYCMLSFWNAGPLNMGQACCAEMSVTNYQTTPRNIPEE